MHVSFSAKASYFRQMGKTLDLSYIYSSKKIRKTQNERLNMVFQNLNGL